MYSIGLTDVCSPGRKKSSFWWFLSFSHFFDFLDFFDLFDFSDFITFFYFFDFVDFPDILGAPVFMVFVEYIIIFNVKFNLACWVFNRIDLFMFNYINTYKYIYIILPIILVLGFIYKNYKNKKILKLWELEEELENQ